MNKLLVFVILSLLGSALPGSDSGVAARAVSPDGRNEIRLWTNPLAYEVVRDCVVLVAKFTR